MSSRSFPYRGRRRPSASRRPASEKGRAARADHGDHDSRPLRVAGPCAGGLVVGGGRTDYSLLLVSSAVTAESLSLAARPRFSLRPHRLLGAHPPASAGLAQKQPAGVTFLRPKGEHRSGRTAAPPPRPQTRAQRVRHRPRRGPEGPRVARAARPGAGRPGGGRAPWGMGGRRGDRGRRGCPLPAGHGAHRDTWRGDRDVLSAGRWLRSAVEDACRAEGLQPAGWREVPIRTAALGVTALASLPRIDQLVLAPPSTRTRSGAHIELAAGPSGFQGSTSPRCRSARSRTRLSAPPRSSLVSIPTSRIPSSLFRLRSSISASRRTPSRAGSARSRSGFSATTVRSIRSTATSRGRKRARALGDEPGARARARS